MVMKLQLCLVNDHFGTFSCITAGRNGRERKRPFLASEENSLRKAERWRRQIIGEVSRRVSQIQNAGLGEFKIRDLNDEINKLLREKGHWEARVVELGGPDYQKVGPKMLDSEGKEVPGNRGYKYFGAAKDLPGVRELFEQEPTLPARKTRAEMMKRIDADYYGYRDEDDGVLVPLEVDHEKQIIADAVGDWRSKKEAGLLSDDVSSTSQEKRDEEEDIYAVAPDSGSEEEDEDSDAMDTTEGQERYVAHVPVPSQKEVEEALLRRKKMELFEKYASESLMKQGKEAKALMGL
ncbi:putative pre-mRNA-splicing factor ISY1-like [Apostichopus japonicus]|uniref:Putative pre-mRNA-splicing factor ISY1-like n=1 Tax=Stichopus japonicus TaxID=307972 RepID=A0A2G8KBA7_STIJA|nr:putative pre-mRNA-splicing factor ISY1-like [Apostichopus japonicus]